MEKSKTEENRRQWRVRKPFGRPSLRVYGNISAITQAGGMGPVDDGATGDGNVMNRTGA
jgi:hypothetical protein